jgi:hypothetical protein
LNVALQAAIGLLLVAIGVTSLGRGGATFHALGALTLVLGTWDFVKCAAFVYYRIIRAENLG